MRLKIGDLLQPPAPLALYFVGPYFTEHLTRIAQLFWSLRSETRRDLSTVKLTLVLEAYLLVLNTTPCSELSCSTAGRP